MGIEVTGIGAGLDGILDCMARYGRVALLGCTRNKDFTSIEEGIEIELNNIGF